MIQRIIFSFLLTALFTQTTFAQHFCATMAYDSLLQHRHAGWQQDRTALEAILQQRNPGIFRIEAEETVRIPVVVHVVHNQANSQPGTEGNISDAQIRSQIDVLNEDYRRKPNTRGFNADPVGADVNIEFFLATCDPSGRTSTGITRTYNAQKDFDVFSDDEKLKSLAYWPSDQYMNIWVTDVKTPYIGYTQFPDMSGLEGLSPSYGPATTDGLVIDYKVFGRQVGAVTSALYGYGRTTTHEVGHWLGLKHTWGDVDCGNDYVNDTPPTRTSNQANDNSCTPVFSDCEGSTTRNMIENYMDYTPDLCMNIFTQGQKERIRKVLATSPRRKSLVANSSRCEILPPSEQLSIVVYPNPANSTDSNSDVTFVNVLLKDSQDINLQVYDALGRLVFAEEYLNLRSRKLNFSNRQLKKGMYFVSVTTSGGEKTTTRLVVIR
jgi:hypothetical protein